MNGRSPHLRIINSGIASRPVEREQYVGNTRTPVATHPPTETRLHDFLTDHASAKTGAAPVQRLIELRPRLLTGVLMIVSGALLFSFCGGVLVGLALGLHIGQRNERVPTSARPAAIVALPPVTPAPQQSVGAPDDNMAAADPPPLPIIDPVPTPAPTAFEIETAFKSEATRPVPAHEPDGTIPAMSAAEAEHAAPAVTLPPDAPVVPAQTVPAGGIDTTWPTYVDDQAYWVQIGAFRTEVKAQAVAASRPDARVVRLESVQRDGLSRIWHVVQIGPIASLAEANRTTMLLRNDGFRDAFVTTGSIR